jgi:hypothetical protein
MDSGAGAIHALILHLGFRIGMKIRPGGGALIQDLKSAQCSASRNRSASIAAMQPDPAAVTACR